MSTILVTGASGFVGSHVVPALLADGHRIVALVRSDAARAKVLGRLEPGVRDRVETRTGDITSVDSIAEAARGTDVVVHLVAIPLDHDGGASLRLINTEGTRNVIAALTAAGVGRLVHMGALGVADDPALHYASSKAKAEALVAASRLDWTILKPSLQWGERDGFFNILAGLVRISPGVLPMPGRGTSQFQPIAVDDVARIVALASARPDTIRRTYELGGPRVWTYRELVEEVLRGMGARRLIIPMPMPLVRVAALTAEALRLPFPAAPDQVRQLRLDNVGPIDGVERGFGFEPTDMAGQLSYLRRKLRDQEPGVAPRP